MAKRPPELVDTEVALDLDALWAGVREKLEARGFDADATAIAARAFWEELAAADDWLKVTTTAGHDLSGADLALVAVLSPAFERRFIAKATRLAGRAYVRSA